MLAQIDPLPRSQRQAATLDRERQRRAEQRRLDVGGHIVIAFEGVRPVVSALGHRLVGPAFEVAANVG